jgi:hypothetical protein
MQYFASLPTANANVATNIAIVAIAIDNSKNKQ